MKASTNRYKTECKEPPFWKDPETWSKHLGWAPPTHVMALKSGWTVVVWEVGEDITVRLVKSSVRPMESTPSILVYATLGEVPSPHERKTIREGITRMEDKTGLTLTERV